MEANSLRNFIAVCRKAEAFSARAGDEGLMVHVFQHMGEFQYGIKAFCRNCDEKLPIIRTYYNGKIYS